MKKNKKRSFLNLLFSRDQIKRDIEINKNIYKEIIGEHGRKNIKETFEEAIERLELSEEDLIKRQNIFKRNAYIYYTFSAILLILNIMFYNIDSLLNNFLIYVFITYLFILGFMQKFNAFQIEKRKLDSLKDFLKEPKKWL